QRHSERLHWAGDKDSAPTQDYGQDGCSPGSEHEKRRRNAHDQKPFGRLWIQGYPDTRNGIGIWIVADKLSEPACPSSNQILQGAGKRSGAMAHDCGQRALCNVQPKTSQSPGGDRRARPRSPVTFAERVPCHRRKGADRRLGFNGEILRHNSGQLRQDAELVDSYRSCQRTDSLGLMSAFERVTYFSTRTGPLSSPVRLFLPSPNAKSPRLTRQPCSRWSAVGTSISTLDLIRSDNEALKRSGSHQI